MKYVLQGDWFSDVSENEPNLQQDIMKEEFHFINFQGEYFAGEMTQYLFT